ncbi:MAG: hypothetical protein C0507_03730 [Cyanobacteria bacterium PR.3.49]|nr:hypothetical protein [Cyanobacteria bacterium PR.3.49]
MSINDEPITSDNQFLKKAEHRRFLANLPIEEKLRRLVKLQGIAYAIGKSAGRTVRAPWGKQKPIL